MTSQTDTDNRTDELVKRYAVIRDHIAALESELDGIKAELRDGGTRTAPCGITVTVTPQRRFNAEQATKVLATSPALLQAITRPMIDTTLAKEQLPPALYEACMAEVGSPRVVVK